MIMVARELVPAPSLDRLLQETFRLLTRARECVDWVGQGLDFVEDADMRLTLVRECSRLTARLTAVLSWLMTHKAVTLGEIAADDPRARLPLFGIGDSRVDPVLGPQFDGMTDDLTALLRQSADLFARISRLDNDMRLRRNG